jgi:hypothetical protein
MFNAACPTPGENCGIPPSGGPPHCVFEKIKNQSANAKPHGSRLASARIEGPLLNGESPLVQRRDKKTSQGECASLLKRRFTYTLSLDPCLSMGLQHLSQVNPLQELLKQNDIWLKRQLWDVIGSLVVYGRSNRRTSLSSED